MRALQTRDWPKGASSETVCVAQCNARTVLLINDSFNSHRLRVSADDDRFMPLKYASQAGGFLFEWVDDGATAPVESSLKSLVHTYRKISAC